MMSTNILHNPCADQYNELNEFISACVRYGMKVGNVEIVRDDYVDLMRLHDTSSYSSFMQMREDNVRFTITGKHVAIRNVADDLQTINNILSGCDKYPAVRDAYEQLLVTLKICQG